MNPTISREASGPPRPQYIVRLLGICSAIFGTALLIWGHWLWGTAIILAIPLTIWVDRRMTKQAQREARQTRPFPDYEKWRRWDANI